MNKPVAWTNKYNLQAISEEGSGSVWSEPYFNGDVPLYLYPEKTLKEILTNIKCIADDISGHKDYENTYSDGWIDACNSIYDEVFAMLEKAQEK